jgi:ATP-dependent Clp protease adaptor protein ClpS
MTTHQPRRIEHVVEAEKTKRAQPPHYRVLMFNDDFTTKEFVVRVLVEIFHKAQSEATELMWRIHSHGKGVAGVFPRDIAETKVAAVSELAREQGYPLKLSIEPERTA